MGRFNARIHSMYGTVLYQYRTNNPTINNRNWPIIGPYACTDQMWGKGFIKVGSFTFLRIRDFSVPMKLLEYEVIFLDTVPVSGKSYKNYYFCLSLSGENRNMNKIES